MSTITPRLHRSKNLQYSLVGMFFHVNWLHDRWYEAGFDEASGNAQKKNFGLGGLEVIRFWPRERTSAAPTTPTCPLRPTAPARACRCITFVGMQPAKPQRTSNHEALITFHEMGHYITNRLVGNCIGLGQPARSRHGRRVGRFFRDLHDLAEHG